MKDNIKYRTYKYKIKPTDEQRDIIARIFAQCCYICNCYVEDYVNKKDLNVKAKVLLEEYVQKDANFVPIDGSALMNVLFRLQDGKIPKALRKNISSYTTTNLFKQNIFMVDKNHIFIPKVGSIEIVYHRPLPQSSSIFNVTIIKSKSGNYHACVSIKLFINDNTTQIDTRKSIGLDYSAPHFYVDDKGNKIDMPRYYQKQEEILSRYNHELSRCLKDGKNYFKVKRKIDKKYQHIKNERKDFLHKLSTKLVEENDVICVENLGLQEMVNGNYHVQRSTYENSYATFIEMLEYKTEDKGKQLIKVDRYFPSSKTCSVCGNVNKNLKLSDRVWTCPGCKTKHDRDINSAKNILTEGLRIYNDRRISG